MKAWLRVPFAILALLAMFAVLLPETVWACPMTGRVDSATRVCTMLAMKGQMPCARFGGKCCKPLSVPPSQSDDDSGRAHVFTEAHDALLVFKVLLPTLVTFPFVVPAQISFAAPAVRHTLARFADSSSPPSTQYRNSLYSGRAPPIL